MFTPILIAPDLYQLPAQKPAAHCYLIKGNKNTLIDTGIREHKDILIKQLKSLNLSLKDIDEVIYTHCHYDHTGGGEFFPDAKVYAHALCKAKLLYQDETCVHALKYRVALPTRIPDNILRANDSYQNGEYNFLILYTPGHSDDGICLLESEKKLLISGDTIFAKGIPSLITDSGSDASLIDSIELLKNYDIHIILPGHGRIEYEGNTSIILSKNNVIKRIQKTNQKISLEASQCLSKKY